MAKFFPQLPQKKVGGIVISFFLLGMLVFFQLAFAQIDAPKGIPSIDEQKPEGYAEAKEYTPQTFVNILGQIRDFLLIVGILFIVSMLVISGVSYIQAKGSGDKEKLTEAKNRLIWTLIGAAVIMVIYVLISTLRGVIAGQSLV